MPFSSGTFAYTTSGLPVVTGTTISSTVENAKNTETATGLTACLLKDGTQTVTANIPMATFIFTGLGAGTAAGHSIRYEQAWRKNAIINGDFLVAQRGTSFTSATTPANSDDTYLLDRWILLSDGNDIVDVTQESSTVPTNGLYAITLDVETANAKFGKLQVIEQKNCKGYIGETCTLSFKARYTTGATVQTMRAVILAWSGAADAVTSDVVSAWGASGTNPTLVANWTAENTAADLTLTTSYQTFSVSAAIDTASASNIGIFLYYNNADGTVGDKIHITDVQLEVGSVATTFERRTFQDELALCQRYFEKSFQYGTAPAQAVGGSGVGAFEFVQVVAASTAQPGGSHCGFATRKFDSPTITFYNWNAANAQAVNRTTGGDCTSTAAIGVGQTGFSVQATTPGGTALGQGLSVHWAAVSEL